MRNYDPEGNDLVAEPDEFDAFAPPPRSVPNLRQERVRRRRRYVRMALTLTLPVAMFFILWRVFEMDIDYAVVIPIVALHGVMGFAELILGDRKEPDSEERAWVDIYARWFGFRDW
jgi:hypothetical protein